jgi:hypothetical protein
LAGLSHELFADLARNLLFGRQRFPGRPTSVDWIRSGRGSVVNDSTGRSYNQRRDQMLYDSATVTKVNSAAHIKVLRERGCHARRQEQVASDLEPIGERLETCCTEVQIVPHI